MMTRNYPLLVSEYEATLKCRECEIFIGIGHVDAIPLEAPDGDGYLCRACHQTETRRLRPGWRRVAWSDAR
jgi:hypothetical protein